MFSKIQIYQYSISSNLVISKCVLFMYIQDLQINKATIQSMFENMFVIVYPKLAKKIIIYQELTN